MKLLLDEMWDPEIAVQLRRRRAIVTEDAGDYRVIAVTERQQGRTHAGLIITSNHRFPRRGRGIIGPFVTALAELLSQDTVIENTERWLRWRRFVTRSGSRGTS